MESEYVEQRNGGYYIRGTRISVDSVVYSFHRGNAPEGIQKEYELLALSQIYGAIAFYLDHREAIDEYLAQADREIEENSIPLEQADPMLWEKLHRARARLGDRQP